jgi:hypothetical protein
MPSNDPIPEPWSIEWPDTSGNGVLRVGSRWIPLADIRDWTFWSAAEFNFGGHLVAMSLFMAAGSALAIPVAMGLLDQRFLAGAALFLGIAAMVWSDLGNGHRLVLHRVRLRLGDGRDVIFTSASSAVSQRLVAALESTLRR